MAPACWLCGGGFKKDGGLCSPSCHTYFSSFLYATGAFQVATPVLGLRGSESKKVNLCVGSLGGTAWGSSSVFHRLNSHWFYSQKLWGLIFLTLESWAGDAGVGLGLFAPEISLPNFYPPYLHVGPACFASSPLLPV